MKEMKVIFCMLVTGFVIAGLFLQSPPIAQSANENALVVHFITGADDLRGGNDNVNVEVFLRAGAPLRFKNVNGGQRWKNNSTNTISQTLPPTLTFEDIVGIRLETTFGGGIGGDNWN